jgi:hypothetical protein
VRFAKCLIAIFIYAVPICSTVSANTPDYLNHIDEFKFASEMLTSSASCKHFAFEPDETGIQKYAESTISDAVKDGMSVDIANQLFLSELRDDQKRQEYINKNFEINQKTDSTDEQGGPAEEYLSYWMKRCVRLSQDVRSSKYFIFDRSKFDKLFPEK